MDGWQSGLLHLSRKQADPNGSRGFKSYTIRQKFMSVKCYGSTAVSKTVGRGSIPWMDANLGF